MSIKLPFQTLTFLIVAISKPACSSSAWIYSLFCGVGADAKNEFMNFIPATNSSTWAPVEFKMPTKNRNLTGSPKRSLNVDNASDTAVWPLKDSSQTLANNCEIQILNYSCKYFQEECINWNMIWGTKTLFWGILKTITYL